MTFQYASDLHLEFPQNQAYLRAHPIVPMAEVLLLAGDVVPFKKIRAHQDFFDTLARQFKVVYWVPGNHEYYHAQLDRFPYSTKSAIRDNVWLVNNTVETIGSVRCVFSTLWSKITPANAFEIQNRLSDFHTIQVAGRPFSAAQYNALHEDSLHFLHDTLAHPHAGPTLVVTHHVPTYLHYPEQYKGDALNEAFATELFDFIADQGPDCWIFGHHHCNTPEFVIGNTRMLTNQLGYVGRGEEEGFSGGKTVEMGG